MLVQLSKPVGQGRGAVEQGQPHSLGSPSALAAWGPSPEHTQVGSGEDALSFVKISPRYQLDVEIKAVSA